MSLILHDTFYNTYQPVEDKAAAKKSIRELVLSNGIKRYKDYPFVVFQVNIAFRVSMELAEHWETVE